MPPSLIRIHYTVDIINLISDTLSNLLMIAWSETWIMFHVCEQVTMNESFLEYFVDVDGMFGNIIRHMGQNIWWREKIFCHVFMDEIYSRMKFWMTNEKGLTFRECWQYTFFCENWTKKKGWKTFMLVYFEIFDTWNVKVIFQVIFCISSIWSILNSTTSKPYRMLN
jgi:hypothetical protein